MLERERPDIVVIARHWYDDGRVEEIAGGHRGRCAKGLYVEKPLAPWPDQSRAVMDGRRGGGNPCDPGAPQPRTPGHAGDSGTRRGR